MAQLEYTQYVKNGLKRKDSDSAPRERKPDWLKVKLPSGENYAKVKQTVRENRLSTVCEEAMCPNLGECWGCRHRHHYADGLTFVPAPANSARWRRATPKAGSTPKNPRLAAESVKLMGLKYVVLTSVDRDDLDDGGAGHYAAAVQKIKEVNPDTAVEALTPDFQGNLEHVSKVLESGIQVFAQNIETVKRLTHPVRDPRASYEQTLKVLAHAKAQRPDILTKTSVMLGLGETDEEILETMDDLRAIGVDIVTFGQYLRPTAAHLRVERYVTPEQFNEYRDWGLEKGFLEVVSGPLVRSSYRAEQALNKNNVGLENKA